MLKSKFALVSDFDGTISDNDFFYYITNRYFNKEALVPWQQYLAGKKKHFDALNEMFQKLREPQKDLKDFILTIKIDKTFFNLADLCVEKNIPIYICSAGCDYYINILLKKEISAYKIKLITNTGTYSKKTGLNMTPNKQYYDENLGTSKAKLVQNVKKQGYKVIYCGDGKPDIEPAKLSDKVFARKTLFKECQNHNINAQFLDTFNDVCQFIKENTP